MEFSGAEYVRKFSMRRLMSRLGNLKDLHCAEVKMEAEFDEYPHVKEWNNKSKSGRLFDFKIKYLSKHFYYCTTSAKPVYFPEQYWLESDFGHSARWCRCSTQLPPSESQHHIPI